MTLRLETGRSTKSPLTLKLRSIRPTTRKLTNNGSIHYTYRGRYYRVINGTSRYFRPAQPGDPS